MKNYYELLEVDKNASLEIIEKAYKTLVKKYHPDLQNDNKKTEYEEKLKLINEAFAVLSDSNKRTLYDKNLEQTEISIDEFNTLYNENINLKKEIAFLKNNYNKITSSNINQNNQINKNIPRNNNIYYGKNYFKYNFLKTSKDLLAFFITIIIIVFTIFILLKIPVTKNYLLNIYNNNKIIQFFVNLFLNIKKQ